MPQQDRLARRTSQARQPVPSCECLAEAIQPLLQDQQWKLDQEPCRACRRQTRTGSERVCVCTDRIINYAAGHSLAAAPQADGSAHPAGVCPSSRKAALSGSRYSAGTRRGSSCSRTGSAVRSLSLGEKEDRNGRESLCTLQKLETEAALQQKSTPKTPQPAFPQWQDSFHLPSRQDSQKSFSSQTTSAKTPTPRKLFQAPGSEESFIQDRQLQDFKEELKTQNAKSGSSQLPDRLDVWQVG